MRAVVVDFRKARGEKLAAALEERGCKSQHYEWYEPPPVAAEWDLLFLHTGNCRSRADMLQTLWANPVTEQRFVLYTGGEAAELNANREWCDNYPQIDGCMFVEAVRVDGPEALKLDDWFEEWRCTNKPPQAHVFVKGSVPPVYEAKLAILFELIHDTPDQLKMGAEIENIRAKIVSGTDPTDKPNGRYTEDPEEFKNYKQRLEELQKKTFEERMEALPALRAKMLYEAKD